MPNVNRLIYITDVQAKLGAPEGRKPPTREWIVRHVAPTKRLRIGKYIAWKEEDFEAWLAEQGDQRESA